MTDPAPKPNADFAKAAEEPAPSLLAEFWDFLKHNKKWWLLPILIVIGLMAVLIVLSSSAVAPFIYPLF
uniref:Uncharacterized protein n=1 Tax=Schlesneria paludicola TaxID=360056 RepID=A0A7C2K0V2_9PLAN